LTYYIIMENELTHLKLAYSKSVFALTYYMARKRSHEHIQISYRALLPRYFVWWYKHQVFLLSLQKQKNDIV